MEKKNVKIAGIILAAGTGSRMGRTKQLLPVGGIPMLQRVVNAALESELNTVIVVLGHDSVKIRDEIDLSAVTVVSNPDFKKGQSTSLRAGLNTLNKEIHAALFLLGDQPLVDAGIINQLIKSFRIHRDPILRPVFNGKAGNPVLMDKSMFPFLLEQSGDVGGRGIFNRFKEKIREVPVQHEGVLLDLDTPEAYSAFLNRTAFTGPGKKLLDVLAPKAGSVISFVGAGGKTSTVFQLGYELKKKGFHVLVTTTTAMYHPDRDSWAYDRLLLTANPDKVLPPALPGGSLTIAAAALDPDSQKIRGYKPGIIDTLHQQHCFDYILVEADGSKEKPLKAPAAHEPVIPSSTRYLFGLLGLRSLGKPLHEDWVHRSSLYSQLTGLEPENPISPESVHTLISSTNGLFKNRPEKSEAIVILNGADTEDLFEAGCRIGLSILSDRGARPFPKTVLVCRMHLQDPVLAVYNRSNPEQKEP